MVEIPLLDVPPHDEGDCGGDERVLDDEGEEERGGVDECLTEHVGVILGALLPQLLDRLHARREDVALAVVVAGRRSVSLLKRYTSSNKIVHRARFHLHALKCSPASCMCASSSDSSISSKDSLKSVRSQITMLVPTRCIVPNLCIIGTYFVGGKERESERAHIAAIRATRVLA